MKSFLFRIRVSGILKEYLVRGYSGVNQIKNKNRIVKNINICQLTKFRNVKSTVLRIFFFSFSFVIYFHSVSAQKSGKSHIYILGTAQDGGYPHAGCTKTCCSLAWQADSLHRFAVSFALVDSISKKWWLFEATPDIKFQLHYFNSLTGNAYNYLPDGIFITHAHIGHYTGLVHFGREVLNTKELPVYVLPKMKEFLETNGPWSQLVKLNNITLHTLNADSGLSLPGNITIETLNVPHRDEYSETAGFRILTTSKKYLFIPDIDKWEKWHMNIIDEVKRVDIALLDGTFYKNNELPGRKMSEVPHPFVTETLELFSNEGETTKSKLYFIHLNHTNPLIWNREVIMEFKKAGGQLAAQGSKL